jgi:hypothetical protein
MDKETKEKLDFDDIISENRVKNWIYWYLVGDENSTGVTKIRQGVTTEAGCSVVYSNS